MLTALDDLRRLAIFAAVAEAKSFTGAAATLNLTKAAVSRQIALLEDRLGTRLIQRTTRQFRLTEAGREVFEHSRRIVLEAEAVNAGLERRAQAPSGHLKITAPIGLGQRIVAPALGDFLDRNPRVTSELILEDRPLDIVAEGIDVAVRGGRAADSTLIARRLAPLELVVVGAPVYLHKRGVPKTPEALMAHDWIAYTLMGNPQRIAFRRKGETTRVVPTGRLATNDGEALRVWVEAGLGLGLLPLIWVDRDLKAGRLQRLLVTYDVPDATVYAIHAHGRSPPPKIKEFIELLTIAFR